MDTTCITNYCNSLGHSHCLFIYELFNDTISSSDCSVSNGRLINDNESGRMREKPFMAYPKVISRHSPGGTEKTQSEWPVPQARFEPGTSTMQIKSIWDANICSIAQEIHSFLELDGLLRCWQRRLLSWARWMRPHPPMLFVWIQLA
jgi:hypothetical protein